MIKMTKFSSKHPPKDVDLLFSIGRLFFNGIFTEDGDILYQDPSSLCFEILFDAEAIEDGFYHELLSWAVSDNILKQFKVIGDTEI